MKPKPANQEEAIAQIRGSLKSIEERFARVESLMLFLLRQSVITKSAADPLADIHRRRFAYFSQHEEDGLLYALLEHVGPASCHFVEIGCGGNGGNSGFLGSECGWSGLMVDATDRAVHKTSQLVDLRRVTCVVAKVTSRNVCSLLAEHETPEEPDLFSLDIDSLDYWVLEAATSQYRPRVIVSEYNSVFGPTAAVTVPDAETFKRPTGAHLRYCYGASLAAITGLCNRRGYRLVMTDATGTNAFFVRNDLAPHIPGTDVASAFRYYLRGRQLSREVGDPVAYFRLQGLTLVDV